MFRPFLKMRFFRDGRVCIVLKSSCIIHTFRFSTLASCFVLPPASMQSSARNFLALAKKSLFLEALYRVPIRNILTLMLPLFIFQAGIAQAAEIRDPMRPPAFALQKFQQARWKNANKVVIKATAVKKTALKPMQLTSILYSPERKIAIIDDQTLRVGDAIRNAKLIKINKDSVRLMKKGKFIDLLLNDELTAIKKITIERKL